MHTLCTRENNGLVQIFDSKAQYASCIAHGVSAVKDDEGIVVCR